MPYLFLKKASSQPDLEDFCEYLKIPLMTLEDIIEKYNQLPLNKKVNTDNLEIYRKCDAILEKHLPRIVDNFCAFSFDYRHNEKIRIDKDVSLTAKEILLNNLSKIIEEIKIIEKEFNSNNSFEAVVQTKILSKYGYQPELIEGNVVQKESIPLENKFNYDIFVKNKTSTALKSKPVILNKNSEQNSINTSVSSVTKMVDKSKNEYKARPIYDDPIMQPTEVGAGTALLFIGMVVALLMFLVS